MKLLIVEDERQLSDSIVRFLGSEDYLCEQAFSYEQAYERIATYIAGSDVARRHRT